MDILLVDDHADTTRLLARLLTREGHRVREANDYGSALDAARQYRPDLLVCDIGLGQNEHDGCDLLKEVMARYPVKAIALTGYDAPEVQSRIRQAGFCDYLTKPVDFEGLIAAIEGIDAEAARSVTTSATCVRSEEPLSSGANSAPPAS